MSQQHLPPLTWYQDKKKAPDLGALSVSRSTREGETFGMTGPEYHAAINSPPFTGMFAPVT